MKAFVKEFLRRGFLFCGGGPFIVAVIYLCIAANGAAETVTFSHIAVEILSSLLLAFIAAGVTAVYTVDRLQLSTAALIHGAVAFIDYLGIYLLNGWIPMKWQAITLFIVLFAAVFMLIFFIIYKVNQRQIQKLNSRIQ